MLNASASEEVALSADAVWAVIGDFGGIRKWAPMVVSEQVEDSPEGKVRTLVMPPDGRVVRELLARQSQYSYTYKFLGEHPLAAEYLGTVSVTPVDGGKSRIELRSDFNPRAGVSEEDIVTSMGKNARGNLKAMKRALGLPT